MSDDNYVLIILAVQLGVTLFCANQLLMHQRHQRVYIPLALFFAAQGFVSVVEIVSFLWAETTYREVIARWGSLTFPVSFMQPLFFWLYVHALTSEDEPSQISHKGWHALPVIIATFAIVLMFMLPSSIFENKTLDVTVLSDLTKIAVLYFQMMELVFYAQVGIYLFLTMRTLAAYSARLKDLFATTEDRELSWVWWITTIVSAYLLLSIGDFLADVAEISVPTFVAEVSELMDDFVSLAITWVIGLWGVRQRPGLMRNTTDKAARPDRSEMSSAKYERSALTDEHAARIAAKIEKAMFKDLLYRDANLSLWDLAKHISVTSNYVSQTLNMTLQCNFFDYVNKWRIQDAVKQLHDTDETILVIAFDVGFNSRSSFYNAFKREMGMTPSALRARAQDVSSSRA